MKYDTEPRRRYTQDVPPPDRSFTDYADYYHPYASDPFPRPQQQRGPPDGRPFANFDDDLPSVDIYGGSLARNTQEKKPEHSHTFPVNNSK